MTARTDLYSSYANFTDQVLADIRAQTFGDHIGQNSWTTRDEYDRFISLLKLDKSRHILEVASGSGGPALYLARATGCTLTGIDANQAGVDTATRAAAALSGRVRFVCADATARLPFDDAAFDALICIDSMNHFPDRPAILREWRRILRPGGTALFTDPVVITGPVTNDELALRSSIGLFLFVPAGLNERLIADAGLRLIRQDDVTDNAALVSGRWHQARLDRKQDLLRIEGPERFEGLQRFFAAVHTLTSQRRLSRIAYLAERP